MKRRLRWAVIALAAVIGFGFGWNYSANLRGRMRAHYDLSRGKCRILTYGMGAPRPIPAEILRTRYGVEFKAVAQCIVSQSLINYVNGYNEVSSIALRKKFGRDVLAPTFEEAQRIQIRDWARRDHSTVPASMFSYVKTEKSSPGCFRSLARDASVYMMAERCGRPDDEVGKDDFVFVYSFPDRSTVTVHAPSTQRITSIQLTDSEGRESAIVRN